MENVQLSLDSAPSKGSPYTINIQEAQTRIRAWRELVSQLSPFQGKNQEFIPRAMYIPYEDLKKIIDNYDEQRKGDPKHKHKHPMGIRVYYGFLLPTDPIIGPPGSTIEMRISVVPVTHEGKDFPYIMRTIVDGVETSSAVVFDFTSPCPSTCDPTSVLYVD